MRLRFILALSAVLLVAVYVLSPRRDQAPSGSGPRASETAAQAPEASTDTPAPRLPGPAVTGSRASRPRPNAPAATPNPAARAPAARPEGGAADRPQPVPTPPRPAATGFNPETFGEILSISKAEGSEHPYPAPVVIADLDLVALGLADPQRGAPNPAAAPLWWKEVDGDGDGQIARERAGAERPAEEFGRLDLNGDGLLTRDEYLCATKAK